MSPPFEEMVGLAQRYCQLIDASSVDDPSWLGHVADMLPRLKGAVARLGVESQDEGDYLTPDLDARFELYSHLRDLLGERDGYWLEFDRADGSEHMTGSLADDLTDIYCELKYGLRMVDQYPERALKGWRDGFEYHWGQHLSDAQRHLSNLAAQDQLAR